MHPWMVKKFHGKKHRIFVVSKQQHVFLETFNILVINHGTTPLFCSIVFAKTDVCGDRNVQNLKVCD